jgi:AAA domain/RepB DNA-primase from phage plasmid
MSAQIQTFPRPNPVDMRRHLEHLFGGFLDGYQDGLIELAWTEASPPYRLTHGQLYGTDQIDELVAHAVQLNATPKCNVYIGARLRRPDTPLTGRCSASDVMVATAYYADIDDGEASSKAAEHYKDTPPTLIVVTGSKPSLRGQLWWRLDEPISDQARVEAALRGIATCFKADMKIFDQPRVMRLAGSIAWGVKEHRELFELTHIYVPQVKQAAMVTAEHLERNFPPITAPQMALDADYSEVVRATVTTGIVPQERIVDGRERYMHNTVLAVAIELAGEYGRLPTVAEIMEVAWPQFEAKADIMAQGKPRTPQEMAEKCAKTLQRLGGGQVPGFRSSDDVVREGTARKQAREAAGDTRPFVDRRPVVMPPAEACPFTSILDLLNRPEPDWLIEDVLPMRSLAFMWGRSGAMKSFIALDMALRLAYGLPWQGIEAQAVPVLYIAGEGDSGYSRRLKAWFAENPQDPAAGRFAMFPVRLSLKDPAEVARLVANIQRWLLGCGLIVIDTLARAAFGIDENDAKEMGLLIAAADTIKEATGATVLAVHHSGKDEERGMRGSSALYAAADTVLHVSREPGSMLVTVEADKQKDVSDDGAFEFTMKKHQWMVEREGRMPKEVSSLVPVKPFKSAMDRPTKSEIQAMLIDVQARWDANVPWSRHPRAPADRQIVLHMIRTYGCGRGEAERIVSDLIKNGHLIEETIDKHSKQKGLRRGSPLL